MVWIEELCLNSDTILIHNFSSNQTQCRTFSILLNIYIYIYHYFIELKETVIVISIEIGYATLSIYTLLVHVFPSVFNKRQNCWTDRAQIFCGISRDHREDLWMIKFSKTCVHQNLIFENFQNPRFFFYKIREIFCFCFN